MQRELNLAKAKAIVGQIVRHFDEIILTGGEALLFPKLIELIGLCQEKGLKVGILTNGLLLNKSNCRKLVDNRVDSVSISLDSLDSAVNDYLRGKTKIVTKGIMEMIKANKNNKVKIEILEAVTKKNISSIRPLVDFCLKNKIVLWISPVETNKKLPCLKELNLNQCSAGELRLLRKEMSYWAESMKGKALKSYVYNCLNLIANKPVGKISCSMGSDHFVLDVDGNVYPCFLRKDLNLGNINSEDFKTIFKSKKLIRSLPQLKQAKCVRLGCVCLTVS